MRRRLILGIVSTVLLTGLLIGIPLVVLSDLGLRRGALESAQIAAQRTVDVVELRIDQGQPNDPKTLAPYFVRNRQVSITFAEDGRTDVYGAAPGGPTVTATATGPRSSVVIVEPIENTGSPASVALRIAGTTLIAMAIAFLVSRRRARKLADEFDELAQDAARIGSGDTRPARRHRFGELNAIAEALDASSRRVNDMVRTERAFVSDVTHQIRTPLTAISLRLDEVGEATDLSTARIEALEAQAQVARLSAIVDDLLQAARHRELDAYPFDLDQVLEQQAAEWAPVFAAQDRAIAFPTPTGLRVVGTPGALSQVMATLLENASVHGAGQVEVSVREIPGGVVVEVADQGPGIPADLGSSIFERSVSGASGSGLGLSLARALAEHMGARLELVRAAPATFGIFLRVDEPSAVTGQATPDDADAHEVGGGSETAALVATGAAGAETDSATGNTHRR